MLEQNPFLTRIYPLGDKQKASIEKAIKDQNIDVLEDHAKTLMLRIVGGKDSEDKGVLLLVAEALVENEGDPQIVFDSYATLLKTSLPVSYRAHAEKRYQNSISLMIMKYGVFETAEHLINHSTHAVGVSQKIAGEKLLDFAPMLMRSHPPLGERALLAAEYAAHFDDHEFQSRVKFIKDRFLGPEDSLLVPIEELRPCSDTLPISPTRAFVKRLANEKVPSLG